MQESAQTDSAAIAVRFEAITKRFGETVANNAISFSVRAGTIHGVVGENGAGKSTLMHILCGALQADGGSFTLRGERVRFQRPADAIAAGVGMVYQHLSLVPSLTALENIVLGAEPTARGVVNWRTAKRQVTSLIDEHQFAFPLHLPIRELGLAQRQQVDILKAFYRRARVLILDEPTTVLDEQDYQRLAASLREFADAGGTILYVSHRLPEVLELCESVTVLRRGGVVATERVSEQDEQSLAALIVGKPHLPSAKRVEPVSSESHDALHVFELQDIHTRPRPGVAALTGLSLRVGGGEVVGIAGVTGNGQTALARVATGRERPAQGSVTWNGREWTRAGFRRRRRDGLGWIPADRTGEGQVGGWSLQENLVLGRHADRQFATWGVRRRRIEREAVARAVADFGISPGDPGLPLHAFSGGNQQKVLVAREFGRNPTLLIAEQPTRGVDIATAALIHSRLRALSQAGAAVMVISADLEELLRVADRIAVLYQGRVVDVCAADAVTIDTLSRMLGGRAA